ncbi:unnamed protein product [Ranitomeya imitator]|uniref:Ig-like domain-containing protein n=1 Tax=Ranitomeya imitator TaxID=111125 RepID=A0ABN9LT42_9NEOB|nr:unnamed protein product [Ranitomeya imitator]
MDPMKQIYLLLICQGFYLGSVCQIWTFPRTIRALIGSCVEIPCTYDPDGRLGASSVVWYLSTDGPDPEILNTKGSSSVWIYYKDRTSLVPGDNSCTLRIDPVRREDGDKYYYPGIVEDGTTNAASTFVLLSVTEIPNIRLDLSYRLTEGEATIIRCSVDHTCGSSPPSLQWDKPGQVHNQSVEISGGSRREESNLTYIPSYVDDGTPVRCTATYPNGQRFDESGTLNIIDKPTNVTVIVLGKNEVVEGSDVTLQCSSISKRRQVKRYEWYKGKDKTKLPETGREITVRKVTRDEEPYSCAAINFADGRGQSALTEIPVQWSDWATGEPVAQALTPAGIKGQQLPKVSAAPDAAIGVHITVKNEGDFTKLICDFRSSRPNVTHYTWMKDGSILQSDTEKYLTIGNNRENYGQYSCIAHNSVGNSSSSEIYHYEEINTIY